MPGPTPAAAPTIRNLRTRVERKGRGGKTVTLVEGLDELADDERDALARDLRKALGTGAKVEDGAIVVQGDVGERIKAWWSSRSGAGV